MSTTHKDIRIVIPAYKANLTIVDSVKALIQSLTFDNTTWEIIVVDNGMNDNLTQLLENYPVKVILKDEIPSAAYARNEGAKGYNKGIIVFIDSDVVCEKTCIERLIKPIQSRMCDATIGNYSKYLEGLSFPQKYKQLYINHIYNRNDTNICNDYWTAIAAVNANVFNVLRGFDTSFRGANGEDQEFGIRLTKHNYKVLSVQNANGQHRNPYTVFGIIRNDFRKGITAVQNSLSNKVSLTDNRHSRKTDIAAVLFSISTVSCSFGILYSHFLIAPTILSVGIWFFSRVRLSYTFIKNEGIFFYSKAVALMFILDLVRFVCVAIGMVKLKLNRSKAIENPLVTTY